MSIKMHEVEKVYISGEVKTIALKDITLDIKQGEFVVLLGPSGSGKSTLLNVCSGLDSPTGGDIEIDGTFISKMTGKELTRFRRDNLGFIFQQYNLLESLTVKENIEIGRDIAKNPLDMETVIKQVGLESNVNKYPSQLSGGEQQRVAIARAVVKNPKIMFCDEPTGALDEKNAKDVLNIIQDLNTSYNTTVVLITHNPSIGLLADAIVKLNSGSVVEVVQNNKRINANDINWA